jgi:dTDP-4-amino-4,6-dideoxy-D-galactose acyltransferase
MEAESLCRILEWDTGFFGKRIARVVVNLLDAERLNNILTWCTSNNIDCLYFLADASDGATIQAVEDNGFRLVDVRITSERSLTGPIIAGERDVNLIIRPSREEDIPVLRSIARISFRNTRFYYDTNFPRPLCDALYETWIENSCRGLDDYVLVAEIHGVVSGFVTGKLTGDKIGEIGLVGVDPNWQGKGLGYDLVNAALEWFSEREVQSVWVVTQGRNSQAQRLYQRCGFLTYLVQLWYHKWFMNEHIL